MNRRGVTLIELLIAVSLVSLLSLAGLFALRVGLNAMQKSDDRLMANRRAIGAQRVLEGEIAGFMPLRAECATPPDAPAVNVPFFQGEPNSMRFASSYSLEESYRGMARILEYIVVAGENGQGVRLVANEYLYTGAQSAGRFCLGVGPDPISGLTRPRWVPFEAGPSSFVLADKLAFCRMMYKEPIAEPPFERWVPRWANERWPLAVRIEMQPLEADPSHLLPMTITAPLRAQKILGMDYGG